jgi:hypothetical protein
MTGRAWDKAKPLARATGALAWAGEPSWTRAEVPWFLGHGLTDSMR